MKEFNITPDLNNLALTKSVCGIDHNGTRQELRVIMERPLTIYLNSQEIVTAMTIGDYPEALALGYLINQGMLKPDDAIDSIDYEDDLDVVVIRTPHKTNFEEKLAKKTRTSGCGIGTVFGDMMEQIEGVELSGFSVKTSWLYTLAKKINMQPSLYLEAGAIHGCVLCYRDKPLIYTEDVGRHNAVDKIAGMMAMERISGEDKVLYTTGRLTSEMVIKTALMGIPVLVSRSGFTAWGVEIAQQIGLTLIGRMRGKRFMVLAGENRLIFDADMNSVEEEPKKSRRKGSMHE